MSLTDAEFADIAEEHIKKIIKQRQAQNENEMRIHLFNEKPLREKSTTIDLIDDTYKKLASQMLIFCNRSGGIGLAAPQIGVNKRLIVIKSSLFEQFAAYDSYLFNPVIVESSGTAQYTEGCLSVPNTRGRVNRFSRIVVEYTNILGKAKTVEWHYTQENYWGIILQHEIDHLDGILYYDKLDFVQQDKVFKTLNKMRRK